VEQEFLQIIQTNQGIIYKVCRIYRDTHADQEDLFQEIVYQLWKAYPHFKGQALVSTWMYKIALSTAVAKFRKSTLTVLPLEATQLELSDQASEQKANDQKERLYQAISKLSAIEKAVVMLYLEGYRYEEIAGIAGVSETHIGVLLNRAKYKLKNLLTNQ
jgi:RNA polymerase sigma-70 factor (ECF subfamily)